MANRWIEEEKPWAKAKEGNLEPVAVLLNKLLTVCQWVAVCTFPVIPSSATHIWTALGRTEPMTWEDALQPFVVGHQTPSPSPIFPRADLKKFERIEKEALAVRASALESTMDNPVTTETPASTSLPDVAAPIPSGAPGTTTDEIGAPGTTGETPALSYITIDDFAKVQLRVGKVLEAERIPKADKLLRMQVDIGTEKRQILAGIAQYYTPDQMIGRTVVIVANLAPRTLRGYESQGMLLAASNDEDQLCLVNPGEITPGSTVR